MTMNIKIGILLLATFFNIIIVSGDISVENVDTIWNTSIIPSSQDVVDPSEAPPQDISIIYIKDIDTIWNASFIPSSQDVIDPGEAQPQSISTIFVKDVDTIWTKDLIESTDIIPPTTEIVMNETASTTKTLFETIISQNLTLNTSVTGDLNGTLNFTGLENVHINSGSFAGKGFSRGGWYGTIEGVSYDGNWQGVLFEKPEERKVYIKGTIAGGLKGIVEGYLTESVNGSGVYDQYYAAWTISQMGIYTVYSRIDVSGMINYGTGNEYSSELYALQTFIEGKATGYYNGSLSIVLTHVRVDNATNPYYGQSFSIISYVSEYGSGEGWTYDKVSSPGVVGMKGLFTEPLMGIATGVLVEEGSSRTLSISIERIDVGSPPMAYTDIQILSPQSVSTGQIADFIVEYRNYGFKTSEEVIIFNNLDSLIEFTYASSGVEYDDVFNSVSWNLDKLPAKTNGFLSVKARIPSGLQPHTKLGISAYAINLQSSSSSSAIATYSNPNLFVNGINLNNINSNKYEEFTKNQNADWVKTYNTGDKYLDALNVFGATPLNFYYPKELLLPTDYNGLTNLAITDHSYGTCYAYSGGTRTVVTAIRYYNLRCEKLVLISPISGYQIPPGTYGQELEDLVQNKGVKEIIIYQSTKDVIPVDFWGINQIIQVKFDPNDPWLIGKNIIINQIPLPGQDGTWAHWELFMCVNNILKGKKCESKDVDVLVAGDPNIKYGPDGFILPDQKLNYSVEFENEGEGIAFGVYFTDTLDEDINDSTLEIGPVLSKKNGSIIAPPGTYNPATRTITWFVGEVGSKEGGYTNYSINAGSNAEEGTEIINFATVYFPSVPETTRTNGIVSIIDITPPRYSNVDQNESIVIAGETAEVYAYWQDGVRLNDTRLETNESGTWQNISYLEHWENKAWSNFTIQATQAGTVCWRVHADDTAGNYNVTQPLCFNVLPPVGSISDLRASSVEQTWINWTWRNPPEPYFSYVMLYLNGTFVDNVFAPLNFFNTTGLSPDTLYEVSARTVDTYGNVNLTWVNHTARSAPLDAVPPVTSIALSGTPGDSGWYISDVQVNLTATDNEGGTGVNKTTYSFDNASWFIYSAPFNISTEGETTIYYYSEDNAGNIEPAKNLTIKIDRMSLEAIIRFNIIAKDIEIYNSETGNKADYSVLPSKKDRDDNEKVDEDDEKGWTLRQYTLKDSAGSSLVLVLNHKKEGKEARVRVISMQYGGGAVIAAIKNKMQVEYSEEKNGTLKELEQGIKVEDLFDAEAKYSSRKNQTEIKVKIEGEKEQKETRTGIVILELLTDKGSFNQSSLSSS